MTTTQVIRLLGSSALLFGLSGCLTMQPGDSKVVPIKDALAILEDQLHAALPITIGNVAADDSALGAFNQAVKEARCASRSNNPLVPIVTGPISLALQGSITKAQQSAVTASLSSWGSFQYTVTVGQQQQATFPLTFVPLSGIANFYLSQNVAAAANLGDADKALVLKPIMANWAKLRDNADADGKAALNYDSEADCPKPKDQKPGHLIVPELPHFVTVDVSRSPKSLTYEFTNLK